LQNKPQSDWNLLTDIIPPDLHDEAAKSFGKLIEASGTKGVSDIADSYYIFHILKQPLMKAFALSSTRYV
jgi:hypothetical protein